MKEEEKPKTIKLENKKEETVEEQTMNFTEEEFSQTESTTTTNTTNTEDKKPFQITDNENLETGETNESKSDEEEAALKEPGKFWVIVHSILGVISGLFALVAFTLFILFQVKVIDTTVIREQTFRGPTVQNAIVELVNKAYNIAYPYVPFDSLLGALTGGFFAMMIAFFLTVSVLRKPLGIIERNGSKMAAISNDIHRGALTFLKSEGIVIIIYCIITFFVLTGIYGIFYGIERSVVNPTIEWVTIISTPIAFIFGACTSGVIAWVGMYIATKSNIRTANACRSKKKGLAEGLKVAFDGGSVMAMTLVGLGLLSLSTVFMIFRDVRALAGFGVGATSISMFLRVGGGIFTKAADVGADLVGKYEQNIPEDDPRNPATIADNVGDNVGDIAGMGADLFGSYVGSIIASATMGAEVYSVRGIALPFYLATGGIFCSFIGSLFVTRGIIKFIDLPKEGIFPCMSILNQLLWAIRKGVFVAAGLNAIVGSAIIISVFYDSILQTGLYLVGCFLLGLIAGVLIGIATEWFTSDEIGLVKKIANAGMTGPATVIIKGLHVGMLSTIFPVFFVALAVVGCMYFGDAAKSAFLHLFNVEATGLGSGGVYGISIAAVGMLSTLGVTLATDAYGPIADNAGGLAEMSLDDEIDGHVRINTDALDALGNTTAATGKGFAIGSAVLTSLSLMSAFTNSSGIAVRGINLLDQRVLFGLFIGALIPYVFSSLTMDAVYHGAEAIIKEVRHQFRTKRILEGIDKPDHAKCISMCTRTSLKYMILPTMMTIITPVVFGFALGPRAVGGLLGGVISSAFLLAVTLSNTGGAWDNAKKHVETLKRASRRQLLDARELGDEEQIKAAQQHYNDTVNQHKATVVGDTVGDPFKDTSGPSLNILIKLMVLISLVVSPLYRSLGNLSEWYR